MVKMGAKGKSGEIIMVAGLTEENIARLKTGQPIRVTLKQFGFENNGVLFIMYGETTENIEQELSSLIGPQTKIIDET